MQILKLLDVKIDKIIFDNNIVIPNDSKPVNIQIGTNISSIVGYDENNGKCKCTTTVELNPINNEVEFKVVICISGIFDYERNDDHKEIHVAACKKLFPHVQSRVTSFMTMVGFPNFVVEEPQISVENVKNNSI